MRYEEMVKLAYEDIMCGFEKEAFLKRNKADIGDKILKRSYKSNVDKWGSTPDTNALYITGHSGSGKSTVAKKLGDKKTNIIHLDPYFEDIYAKRDNDFDKFLSRNFPQYKEISNPSTVKLHSKEWGKIVDGFEKQIDAFAKSQHTKGNKVIVEGVQLDDDTLYPDKKVFQNKPMLITGTGAIPSFYRARARDGVFRHKGIKDNILDIKRYAGWYRDRSKRLKSLRTIIDAKR